MIPIIHSSLCENVLKNKKQNTLICLACWNRMFCEGVLYARRVWAKLAVKYTRRILDKQRVCAFKHSQNYNGLFIIAARWLIGLSRKPDPSPLSPCIFQYSYSSLPHNLCISEGLHSPQHQSLLFRQHVDILYATLQTLARLQEEWALTLREAQKEDDIYIFYIISMFYIISLFPNEQCFTTTMSEDFL